MSLLDTLGDVVSYATPVGWAYQGGKFLYNAVKGNGGPLSSPDAVAGTYGPADYQYGSGTQGVSAEVTSGRMRDLGETAASDFSRAGQDAQYNNRQVSQGLVDAGYAGRSTGQFYAREADALSGQYNARAYDPKDLGADNATGSQTAVAGRLANYSYDPRALSSQGKWSDANERLANYQYAPSAGATAAAGRLNAFDAGQQTGHAENAYNSLMNYATQGPGASAAEAQLRAGADANVAAQVALSRSGRGAGENAQNQRQAMFAAADIGQRTNADLAALRANESAAWRAQQAQALGQAGALGSSIEAQRQGIAGLNLSAAQSGAQLGQQGDLAANQLTLSAMQGAAGQYGTQNQAMMQATAQAEAARLQAMQASANQYGSLSNYALQSDIATQQNAQGWGALGLQANQTAGSQNAAANQLYANALTGAGQLQNNAAQLNLSAMQAGTGAQAAYENAAMGLYEGEAQRRAALAAAQMGGQTQVSLGNQQADVQHDQALMGLFSNGMGMAARAFGGGA